MKVSGSCGSGTADSSQPMRANSDFRPFDTASPSQSSRWSVKNCHGVEAAHSSPMKSIGVFGASMRRTAPTASASVPTRCDSRSPAARLPTWSWFWMQTISWPGDTRSPLIGRPWARPRKVESVPSWKKPLRSTFGSAAGSAKSA